MTADNTSFTRETRSRPRRSRYLLLGGFGLLAALLFVCLVVSTLRTPHPTPIKIALATPLSGPQRQFGEKILDAVLLCISDANRQGGVQGHPVEVIRYDDEGNPNVAAEKAKEIAASPAVAVIGHYTSSTSLAAGPIYKEASIPAITGSATAPSITSDNPYYFRVAIDNSSQGHTLAAYAKNVLGQKRARVLYTNEVYGKSLFAAFADEYSDQGGELESQWVWDPQGTEKEHAALIQQLSADIANGESGILSRSFTPLTPLA